MNLALAKFSALCVLSIFLIGCEGGDNKAPDSPSDIISKMEDNGIKLGEYTKIGTPDYCDDLKDRDFASWLDSYCNG